MATVKLQGTKCKGEGCTTVVLTSTGLCSRCRDQHLEQARKQREAYEARRIEEQAQADAFAVRMTEAARAAAEKAEAAVKVINAIDGVGTMSQRAAAKEAADEAFTAARNARAAAQHASKREADAALDAAKWATERAKQAKELSREPRYHGAGMGLGRFTANPESKREKKKADRDKREARRRARRAVLDQACRDRAAGGNKKGK